MFSIGEEIEHVNNQETFYLDKTFNINLFAFYNEKPKVIENNDLRNR